MVWVKINTNKSLEQYNYWFEQSCKIYFKWHKIHIKLYETYFVFIDLNSKQCYRQQSKTYILCLNQWEVTKY